MPLFYKKQLHYDSTENHHQQNLYDSYTTDSPSLENAKQYIH